MFTQWEKADIIRNAYRNDKGGDSMAQVNKETTIGELLMTSGDNALYRMPIFSGRVY